VLDVGTPSDPFLRLHIPSENSSKSPYTTLSHCWGTLKIKRLTKANMISLLTSIEISELPKTFQHAIIITRRLGLRYLWIDSLCIIQDSFQDWAQESARMGEIYKNCFCNIAAAAALDGRYGCFMAKNTILAKYCRVRISNCATGSDSAIFNLVPRMLWKLHLDNYPLGRRAWVVQEKFLAPRILHFGKNQLFWECHDLVRQSWIPFPQDFQLTS
jgi:Heterokaryon incompatibility protein (HET)